MKSEQIAKIETDRFSVKVELDNGVVLRVYSNLDYFHITISGDDFETPIEVTEKTGNALNLRYKPRA